MSDVVAVAAITGGASALTSAIAGVVAWRVNHNSTSVELEKVTAENERLHRTNQEEERRERKAVYYKLIDAYRGVYQILGAEVPEDLQIERTEDFNHQMAGVLLLGPPSVRDGAYVLNGVFEELADAVLAEENASPGKTSDECWCEITEPYGPLFFEAGSKLIPLMHADITRGMTDDPDSPSTSRAADARPAAASP